MFNNTNDRLCNTWFGRLVKKLVSLFEFKVMAYFHSKKDMDLMSGIIKEDSPFLLSPQELFLIYSYAKHQTDFDGDYAEVGVFKGATAKAICEAKGNKKFHLFDTFEGLPEISKIDTKFKKKMFIASLDDVKRKLSSYKYLFFYKGLFPQETGEAVQDNKFAFVHLDVDLYQSTKDALEFFYPRMTQCAVLISHDYHASGVRQAFDEFFQNKKERVIELPTSQCMFIKS